MLKRPSCVVGAAILPAAPAATAMARSGQRVGGHRPGWRSCSSRSASRARSCSTTAAGARDDERLVGQQRPQALDVRLQLRRPVPRGAPSRSPTSPSPRRATPRPAGSRRRGRAARRPCSARSAGRAPAPRGYGRPASRASRGAGTGRLDDRAEPRRRPAFRPPCAGCGPRARASRDPRRPSPPPGRAADGRWPARADQERLARRCARGSTSPSACQISSVTNGMSGMQEAHERGEPVGAPRRQVAARSASVASSRRRSTLAISRNQSQ